MVYVNDKGRLVCVSSGISGGQYYMTCMIKPSGSLQRVKSKLLPIRNTREEAQRDLDAYAKAKGWMAWGVCKGVG